jgi:hypothetical protein
VKPAPLDWHAIWQHHHWHLYLWFAWALLFVFLETLSIVDGHYASFTYIVKKGVPLWVVAAVLGWIGYHFLIDS